jgi:hypothetical protein
MLKFPIAVMAVVLVLSAPVSAASDSITPVETVGSSTTLVPASGLGLTRGPSSRLGSSREPVAVSAIPITKPGGDSGNPGFGPGGLWIALLGIVVRPVTSDRKRRSSVGGTPEQLRATKAGGSAGRTASPASAVSSSTGSDAVLERYDTRAPFPPNILVVTIGGFGSSPGNTFDSLLASMGVPGEQVANFDWNWDGRFASSSEASRRASVDQGLLTLRTWLSTLPPDVEISFIGHSKGAVLIAEFLAAQDRVCDYDERVRTAMLLDPPLAGGLLGQAQSIGNGLFGSLPNDGGFKRKWYDGTDKLNDIGRAGGVVVRIIRNPDATVTNVGPSPGVVMYDLRDDGAGTPLDAAVSADVPWWSLATPGLDLVSRVVAGGRRVAVAHSAIVNDPQVAVVTRQEIVAPGSSTWWAGSVSALPAEPIGPDRRRWGNCPVPSR